MAEYKKIVVGELEVNCYLVYSKESKKCFILDPGDESERIIKIIRDIQLIPEAVILTHAHMDHCGGVSLILSEFDIPLMMHEKELPVLRSDINKEFSAALGLSIPDAPDRYIAEGDEIGADDLKIRVIHTPGHTPGSICLMTGNHLFTGDTLFAGSIGRTDLPGGDFSVIQNSLEILKRFPPETFILPGHGDTTTLKQELEYNPFL
ncbi:MAG: MBL fold metallo-hydrolase [Candidatus Aminicenantes bacterium]|nr:MBL fold metallo-hydrolase [Candidatus Aminicenantes bacterium]